MKRTILPAVFCAITASLHAQISIPNSNPILLNFNNLNSDFGGAYDAVGGATPFPTADPTGATVAPATIYSGTTSPAFVVSNDDFSPGGIYSNISTYSNSNSYRALSDGGTADLAIGLKDSTDRTFTLRLQNNTGSSVSSFSLSYAVEQYSIADSATTIVLSYSLDGTTFVTSNLVGGGTVTAATNGAATDANLSSVASTIVTATINESVANGSELFVRWLYDHQSGTSVHLGLDDIAVSVPEPSAALALLGGAGILLGRRRRSSTTVA